jgi:hypothetical protein
MGKKDPRVDAYIGKSPDFAKPILKHLRASVHRACPNVEETTRWGFPHFDYKGILCSMAAFKQHTVFGFWKEKLLLGTNPGSKGAMGSFGRLLSINDLPDNTTLINLIKKAAALNDKGINVPRQPAHKREPLSLPTFFRRALQKNKNAAEIFKAFSHSHKKEYVDWITEAKKEETRQKRLATALRWIARGKGRNWKYLRK